MNHLIPYTHRVGGVEDEFDDWRVGGVWLGASGVSCGWVDVEHRGIVEGVGHYYLSFRPRGWLGRRCRHHGQGERHEYSSGVMNIGTQYYMRYLQDFTQERRKKGTLWKRKLTLKHGNKGTYITTLNIYLYILRGRSKAHKSVLFEKIALSRTQELKIKFQKVWYTFREVSVYFLRDTNVNLSPSISL